MIIPRRGSFLRNVFTLMAGTTLAQILPVAASPVLTRLYDPQDFGTLALFTAVASILGVIATGRYEMAIMLPREETEAVNLVSLCLLISIAMGLISFSVVAVFNRQIANFLGDPKLSLWLFAVPLSVLLTGVQHTFNYWFNRKKHYGKLSISRVTQSSTTVVANVSMGVKGWQGSGLIVGYVLGQFFSAAYLGFKARWEDWDRRNLVQKALMVQVSKKYQDFPKINSLHAFFDMLQNSGVVFLLSSLFGPAVLGFYFLAMRILKTPLMFIGSSVAQVFYQKATELHQTGGDLQAFVKKSIFSLTAVALPIFLIILFFAPYLFALIFGKEWREAGVYSSILAPWFFLNFIFSPITQIPIIVDRQKMGFVITFLGNSLILLSICYGGLIAQDIYTGLYLLSTILSLYMICFAMWLYRASGRRPVSAEK